jgi:putative endonuclease
MLNTEQKYWVYILKSEKDNRYYIGSSSNVDARLKFHNAGLQRSTKNRIPFKLIYSELLPNKTEALKREKQIKSWKGGNAFQKLIQGV